MELIIDTRESKVVPFFEDSYLNVTITIKQIQVGDYAICCDGNILFIIERKTWHDLAASIKDGRKENVNKLFLAREETGCKIIYLIEGDISKFGSFNDKHIKNTLYSAMFSINYYKGFSLMRSFNLVETATIICNMANKLQRELDKGKQGYYISNTNSNNITDTNTNEDNIINNKINTNNKDYVSVVKKVKKDNITPDNIGEIMLCQIPSISSTTALAVLQKFKTITELIKQIEMQGEVCLNDIMTTDANGKGRKISKACVANIINY